MTNFRETSVETFRVALVGFQEALKVFAYTHMAVFPAVPVLAILPSDAFKPR